MAKAQAKKKVKAKKSPLKVINGGKKEKKIEVIDKTKGSSAHTHDQKILESCEQEIRKASASIGHNFYRIGEELLVVQKSDLYRVGGHESFDSWLTQFFTFSKQSAYNMMAVARALDKETATRIGPSLAYVVARASDRDAQKELLKLAQDGATASELRQKAREQRAERNIVPKSPGRPVGSGKKIGPKLSQGPQKPTRRAVSASKGSQHDMDVSSPPKDESEVMPTQGKRGVATLKEISKKKESALVAGGYTHRAIIDVGGAKVQMEINVTKMAVKYVVL